jgi:V/A-type H+-transporting ATPase subunit C
MAGSPYAVSLGRLKAQFPQFLPRELLTPLANARDVGEVAKLLEPTPYGPVLAQAAVTYRDAELLEVAANRLLVQRNRLGLEVAPFAGRAVVNAYLKRWEIQNVAAILSAKAQGRPVQESETFLVSSRDLPAGLLSGPMTLDDFRLLLQASNVEGVVNQLVRFGYGAVLLPLVEGFQRTKDVFALQHALDRYYFAQLLEVARFFQGDEWTVRRFIQSEIDVRNVLVLLKGKDARLETEAVMGRILEGGEFPRSQAQDAYTTSRTVPEVVSTLEGRFPKLGEGLGRYQSDRSLVQFEVVLTRERALRELRQLRTYPLSLAIIFTFLFLAELERNDIRRIVFAKVYGIAPDDLRPLLILPVL